jgi:predicted transcriptional regulator
MDTHMKTTIELSDALLRAAKQAAQQGGTTLRALIEQGLRQVLQERQQQKSAFRLRDASVGGKGLQPGVRNANWDELRALTYGQRGG